ncbi:MAG: hypothetical protein IJY79_08855 [Clostridia bacterium]|nr:hypothetical protein [Clostridia bacterium]
MELKDICVNWNMLVDNKEKYLNNEIPFDEKLFNRVLLEAYRSFRNLYLEKPQGDLCVVNETVNYTRLAVLASEYAAAPLFTGDKSTNYIFTASQIATRLLLQHLKCPQDFPPVPMFLIDKEDYMYCYFEGSEDDVEKDLADVYYSYYNLEKGHLSKLMVFAAALN